MSRYALSSPCYGPRPADILSVALTVDYAHRICQLPLSSPQQGLRSDMRSVALTMDYVHQTRPQLALTIMSWEGNNTVHKQRKRSYISTYSVHRSMSDPFTAKDSPQKEPICCV